MCGIVAVAGKKNVAGVILKALKRLEYRGYDSAGIATLNNGKLKRVRAKGKLKNLEAKLKKESSLEGNIGIGHTRWATHGQPEEQNAHPHFSKNIAVVHNGIIENFRELKNKLEKKYKFESKTDTEVIAHLIQKEIDAGKQPVTAANNAVKKLKGTFAIAVIFQKEDIVFGARYGPPLAVGHGDGRGDGQGEDVMYLGSDAVALAPLTNKITYLKDGDRVVITNNSVKIFDEKNKPIKREVSVSDGSTFLAEKGNHRHFMIKEIKEQREVIGHTLAHYMSFNRQKVEVDIDFKKFDRIAISACGTAYYAGMIAKYWFEKIAKMPVDVDVASEFRYRQPPVNPNTLAIVISQSGETADTLASLKYLKKSKSEVAALVNVRESTIARESKYVLPTLAGPEIGVASTKAFTCQLAALAALAVAAGVQRKKVKRKQEIELVKALSEIPRYVNEVLHLEPKIAEMAHTIAHKSHVLYFGRDTNYPLAMEGALKLKEISYIHAEGYAAGELKHGPIALVDEDMPIIAIAPSDQLFDKTLSNMQEVKARGGKLIIVTDKKGKKKLEGDGDIIVMPNMPEITNPIVYAIPIQLLAYHTALIMGTDIDCPRNLAKSVTVE